VTGLAAAVFLSAALGAPAPRTQVTDAEIAAPVAEVWNLLATKEGLESWCVAHAEVDLRIGGRILTHYRPEGRLGDDGTIVQTVLAFEPERMLAVRVERPPAGFPYPQAVTRVWHVLTLAPLEGGRTRVRETGVGYGASAEDDGLFQFFETGNARVMVDLQARAARKDGSGAAGR